MRADIRKLLLLLVVLQVVACSQEFKRSVGIVHNSPDEYAVLKNPPLSIPPNFDLIPPQDDTKLSSSSGSVTTAEGPVVVQETMPVVPGSVNALVGPGTSGKASVSQSDKDFINRFSGHEKREDIRELIELKDSGEKDKASESNDSQANDDKSNSEKKVTFFDKVKGWF